MRNKDICVWLSVPLRAWFAALALGTLGLVAVGMTLQHLLNLSPCPLCIFQRVLYMAIGFVALLACLLPSLRHLWSLLIAALASIGGLVAAYQTWLQAFPELASECSYTDPNLIERLVDWLGMQWPSLFMATGFCSSKEWVFLGLSMANWSLVVFLGIIGFALVLFYRREK